VVRKEFVKAWPSKTRSQAFCFCGTARRSGNQITKGIAEFVLVGQASRLPCTMSGSGLAKPGLM